MRTLAISDIHGCYNDFNELLKEVGYNHEEDKLILLGDYVDRGIYSKHVVDKVMDLVNNGVVALRGNHDQMFIDAMNAVDNSDSDFLWLHNGGITTLQSYCGGDIFDNHGFDWDIYLKTKQQIKKHYKHHLDFLNSLPMYHEDEDRIYVHAGIDPAYSDEDWKTQPIDNFIWIREVFLNNKPLVTKTIVFGHTPTKHLHDSPDIYFDEGKIGIDGGRCFGLQLNCLEIIDGHYNTYKVNN